MNCLKSSSEILYSKLSSSISEPAAKWVPEGLTGGVSISVYHVEYDGQWKIKICHSVSFIFAPGAIYSNCGGGEIGIYHREAM